MKILLKKVIVNLRNKPLKLEDQDLTLGIVLSEIVLAPHKDKNGFRPLKAWELAKKFFSDEEVDLDKSDFIQLKEIVESSQSYNPLVIAQALESLEAVKEDK